MRRIRLVPVLVIVAAWLGCAGLVAVAFAEPQRFWMPDGSSIAESVEREGDAVGVPDCERFAPDAWRCDVEIDPYSGTAWTFALVIDDDGCWRGTRHRVDAERTPPLEGRQPMSGCVEAFDHLLP